MKFLPENLDAHTQAWVKLMILVNDADCVTPGPMWFNEMANFRDSTYTEPLLLTGLCSGLPAGPVDISVGAEYYSLSQDSQTQLCGFVQPHLIIEEIYDGYTNR